MGVSLHLKIKTKNKHAIKATHLLLFTNIPPDDCLHGPSPTLTNVETRSFLPMRRNACFKNCKSISSGPHLMTAFFTRSSKNPRRFFVSFTCVLFLLTISLARKVRIWKLSLLIFSLTSSKNIRQLPLIVASISWCLQNMYACRACFKRLCNTQKYKAEVN